MVRFFCSQPGSPKPGRVLALGSHPDDVEVGAGGLLARLADDGAEVLIVVLSVPTKLELRIAETAEGARILGARHHIADTRKTRRVEDVPMYELVASLDSIVGDFQPDLILTHAASDLHWDHCLVNRATVSAVRRTPCDLLAYISSYEMNAQTRAIGECFADISDSIETKLRAISAHKTQLERMDVESSRDLARAMGRIAGCRYAEAFQVLRIHC